MNRPEGTQLPLQIGKRGTEEMRAHVKIWRRDNSGPDGGAYHAYDVGPAELLSIATAKHIYKDVVKWEVVERGREDTWKDTIRLFRKAGIKVIRTPNGEDVLEG